MKNNWLIFISSTNHSDYNYELDSLKEMQKNLSNNVTSYVIIFGPRVGTSAQLIKIDKFSWNVIVECDYPSFNESVKITNFLVKILKKHASNSIKSIIFSFHGSSYIVGCPYKKTKIPFMTITDIVKHVITPFKSIKLVLFDSCYQGSMSCLYELPDTIKYTIASPGYHPYHHMTQTKIFGKLDVVNFSSKESIQLFANKIVCEWNKIASKINYKCLFVIDNSYLKQIGKLVNERFDDLVFDKKSVIIKEDKNLNDLYTSARNIPELQEILTKCVNLKCNKCKNSVSNIIHGISMERRLPRKWQSEYKQTKWALFLKKQYQK